MAQSNEIDDAFTLLAARQVAAELRDRGQLMADRPPPGQLRAAAIRSRSLISVFVNATSAEASGVTRFTIVSHNTRQTMQLPAIIMHQGGGQRSPYRIQCADHNLHIRAGDSSGRSGKWHLPLQQLTRESSCR
jgi:hypothetical protein